MKEVQLAIIGGGPAGLAAAVAARRAGVENILILERDRELGGDAAQRKQQQKCCRPERHTFVSSRQSVSTMSVNQRSSPRNFCRSCPTSAAPLPSSKKSRPV